MAKFDDFIYGPGWKIQWTQDPVDNPTYPKTNVVLIVPSATKLFQTVDLIWVDDQWQRHDLMGIPFDDQKGWLSGDKCVQSFNGSTYKVTVQITPTGQLKGTVSLSSPGITPVAGTWGADANGG